MPAPPRNDNKAKQRTETANVLTRDSHKNKKKKNERREKKKSIREQRKIQTFVTAYGSPVQIRALKPRVQI